MAVAFATRLMFDTMFVKFKPFSTIFGKLRKTREKCVFRKKSAPTLRFEFLKDLEKTLNNQFARTHCCCSVSVAVVVIDVVVVGIIVIDDNVV